MDYLNTAVFAKDNHELLSQPRVMECMNADPAPLPTTDAREGYFSDRHLEYWLSGYRDVQKVINTTSLDSIGSPRVLDFGGASGRTARHFRHWSPSSQVFLCDINPSHVNLTRRLFDDIVSVRNFSPPTLPFENDFFDCVVAFSVFTHLDSDDIGWLLELRRITKPGGYIYATVHDEATWKLLPHLYLSELSFKNSDFESYYQRNPELHEKVVHYCTEQTDYNCNVFVTKEYLRTRWHPLFESMDVRSVAHDHQTAVVLKVG